MIDKKVHYIYEITNLFTGDIYVGKHSTNNINDGYFGSGKNLIKAKKKWSRAAFHMTIIEWFDTDKKALIKERIIVDKAFVARIDTYNIAVGGEGGGVFGKKHSEESKKKISIYQKGRKKSPEHVEAVANSLRGRKKSPEQIRKNSESHKGQIPWNKGKKIGPQKRVTCPHCGNIGGAGAMVLHHFDKCNFNPANHSIE